MIIGAAAQSFLKKPARDLHHKGWLKCRIESWPVECHVPFVNHRLGVFELRKFGQPGFDLANALSKIFRVVVIYVPGEEMQRRFAFAAMLDQRGAKVAVVAGQRRAAHFCASIGSQDRLRGVRVIGQIVGGLK